MKYVYKRCRHVQSAIDLSMYEHLYSRGLITYGVVEMLGNLFCHVTVFLQFNKSCLASHWSIPVKR